MVLQVVVGGVNFDISVTFDKKHAISEVSRGFNRRNTAML